MVASGVRSDRHQVTPDAKKGSFLVRIALVLPSFAGGGAQRVALSLISGVEPERVSIAIFDCQGPLQSLVPAGVNVHDLERLRLRHAWLALLRWLRASRPAVVLSTFGHVNLALLAMRPLLPPGTRLIIREANTPSLALRRGRVPAPALTRYAYRLFYPTADLVLCQYHAMAEEMRTRFGVSVEKIAVLPNPVDSAWLRAGSPRREPGPGRRFVAAGRLTHQKGFNRLIDMVADGGPGDRLCIFGDGPRRAGGPRAGARCGRPDSVCRVRAGALAILRRRRCGARTVPVGGPAKCRAGGAGMRNVSDRDPGIGRHRGGGGCGAAGCGDDCPVGRRLPQRPGERGPVASRRYPAVAVAGTS